MEKIILIIVFLSYAVVSNNMRESSSILTLAILSTILQKRLLYHLILKNPEENILKRKRECMLKDYLFLQELQKYICII